MIGRKARAKGSFHLFEAGAGGESPQRDFAVRWGVGCLVSAVALLGVALLVGIVAFYTQPPAWVQILVGALVAVGAVVLAWLIAAAVGRARAGPPANRKGEASHPRE